MQRGRREEDAKFCPDNFSKVTDQISYPISLGKERMKGVERSQECYDNVCPSTQNEMSKVGHNCFLQCLSCFLSQKATTGCALPKRRE